MTGLPTITVKLDDVNNSGTFPYDISSYVVLPQQIVINGYGRTDEFSKPQPTQMNLTLDNIDGRFTLGSTTYGGALKTDRRIRVTLTVSGTVKDRFTGYVQDWPVEWPDGADTYAWAPITAVDRKAALGRRQLRSVQEEEIIADGPTAYYVLDESDGSFYAANSANTDLHSLAPYGPGAPMQFGVSGEFNAPQFNQGQFLRANDNFISHLASSAASFGISYVYKNDYTQSGVGTTYLGAVLVGDLVSGTWSGIVGGMHGYVPALRDSTWIAQPVGSDNPTLITSSALFNFSGGSADDDEWHVLHLFCDDNGSGTVTVTLYADGVAVSTGTFSSVIVNGDVLMVGGGGDSVINGGGFSKWQGGIAHVAVWNSDPGATRIATQANTLLTGLDGVSSDSWISHLATYAGIPTGEQSLEAGQQAIPAHDTSGSNIADEMDAVAFAEGGLVFLNGSGTLVFQNRAHRTLRQAADLTITHDDIDPGSRLGTDMQLVFNYAAGSTPTGGTVYAANQTSITEHGMYPANDLSSLLVMTDTDVRSRCAWIVNNFAEPLPRFPSLKLDLLTAATSLQQSMLGLEISHHLRVTGMPSQTPGGSTIDNVVEGWTETIGHDTWTVDLNTSPFSPYLSWILGDTTYGVLGSTTTLGL